ncbi:MAG: T9SS type A sorting domain-containing protein [Bacteroidales bacterium]|nr:T9SS type A sorting domain-containing protein [Bacteroidales bacterium]
MKKIIFILSAVLLYTCNCFAQNIVFNNTYPGQSPGLRNVIIQDDGYVGLGFDANNSFISLYIMKTNFYGDTVWTKTYGDTIYHYYHGTRNSLISNIDGGFSLAGSRKNETNNTCLLVKFDQNFDTLWTKLYFDNPDFTTFYNHIQTSDGGYALVGCTTESDADGDVLLVKTDSDGNMLWYKKYGTSAYDLGLCIIETPDNGFLIGAGSMGYGAGDNYIIKTDELGQLQWSTHYGNPDCTDGGITNIIKTIDNGYLLTASHTLYEVGDDGYLKYSQAGLKKIDSNYNEEWYKLYGNVTYQTSFGSIVETEQGDLVLTLFEDYPSRSKLLFLNAQGDSLRKVGYVAVGSNDEQWLFAIKQTEDGGFIMAGVAYDPQVMWLVKTDSCGCVEEDCECGGSTVEEFTNELNIVVYPNPASDLLYLQLPENSGDALVKIYDATGRIVQSEKLVNNQNALNIRGLTAGSYVLKVQFRDNCKTSGFIKD